MMWNIRRVDVLIGILKEKIISKMVKIKRSRSTIEGYIRIIRDYQEDINTELKEIERHIKEKESYSIELEKLRNK